MLERYELDPGIPTPVSASFKGIGTMIAWTLFIAGVVFPPIFLVLLAWIGYVVWRTRRLRAQARERLGQRRGYEALVAERDRKVKLGSEYARWAK